MIVAAVQQGAADHGLLAREAHQAAAVGAVVGGEAAVGAVVVASQGAPGKAVGLAQAHEAAVVAAAIVGGQAAARLWQEEQVSRGVR